MARVFITGSADGLGMLKRISSVLLITPRTRGLDLRALTRTSSSF
jgi:hypothetical protein